MKRINLKSHSLAFFSFLVISVISFLILLGFFVWSAYKEEIIDEQKKQMQLISDSISSSINEMILSQINGVNFLLREIENMDEISNENEDILRLLTSYEETHTDYINGIFINDAAKNIIIGENHLLLASEFKSYIISSNTTLFEYVNSSNETYFKLSSTLKNGYVLNVILDINSYYDHVLSEVKIGNNGYIVVKNSDGIILMHPAKIQIGDHLIDGRIEIYDGVDLSSLENLFVLQRENSKGVYEYYSYWWLEENPNSIRKIAAHTHTDFGEDFLIISAVIDYDDIYTPISESFESIFLIFLLILIIALIFTVYMVRLLITSKKDREEIKDLKIVNNILETTKEIQDNINHQQRLQMIGTMTSGIAHEFNNMLTPILGYTELLKDNLELDNKNNAEYLEEISLSCNRAKDIIKEISSLGKKGADWDFKYIDIHSSLSSSVKILSSSCPNKIRFSYEEHLNTTAGFLGNETQINQVLLNLFVNATHSFINTPKPQITLSSFVVNKHEIESLHKAKISPIFNKYIKLTLTDNGCGMSEETLSQIFTPFFTTKSSGAGLGLGLALTQDILTSHSGYIFVFSTEGVGSEFNVYLPIIPSGKNPKDFSESEPNVLILANSNTNFDFINKYSFKIHTANSVEAANEILDRENITQLLIQNDFTGEAYPAHAINYAVSLYLSHPKTQKIIISKKSSKDILLAKKRKLINGTANSCDEFLSNMHIK